MNRNKATYLFRCPVCRKTFRSDEPWEPCCTGPSEMRHDHEMTVMHLERIDRREVGPQYAAARANGPMIQPPGDYLGGDVAVRELIIARG
jgi:hypothetical protein